MATRLLLEGPDIESLLVRVRDEHGPGARIVSAEKVRSGGFAGFFSRERFEVQVEIDAAGGFGMPGQAAAAAAVPPSAAPPSVPASHVAMLPAGSGAPGSLLDLAEAVDARELAALSTATASGSATTEAHVASTETPAVSTEAVDFASLLADLVAGAGDDAGHPDEDANALVWRPAALVPAPRSGGVVSPHASGPAPTETGWLTPHESARLAPAEPAPAAPAETTWLASPEASRLAALGLPPALVASVATAAGTLAERLEQAFAGLPEAPALPAAPGDVLVVAGDGVPAYEVARGLATRLRLDPAAVLLAAPSALGTGVSAARRISGPTQAQRRSRTLHRADVASVVAVDAPLDDGGAEWARRVADELAAATVWAVVDATRKTADLADQLARLGRVDALVVRNAARTADPASVLALGLPVAVLDGVPATGRAWATLLLDRMERR